MQYITFKEKGNNEVEFTLLAPTATVFIEQHKVRVNGNDSVRLIGKNVDVTGEKWTYEHAGKNDATPKKITIERNVHAVFQTELKDILK
jgi:hypothetical protein